MKIKNSIIFTADIYEAYNCKYSEGMRFPFSTAVLPKTYFDKKICIKKAIVVKFGNKFVPINYVDTIFKFWVAKAQVAKDETLGDRRFLDKGPSKFGHQRLFVEDICLFTKEKGKTDVKDLLEIHNDHCQHPPREVKIFDI